VADQDVLDRVFGALADPTRRDLMARLHSDGPETATTLAGDAVMTRQAIVKHLQVLADAGLVVGEREGREVRYRATPHPLTDATAWLMQHGVRWDRRLDRLTRRIAER
jgi:DNA-binding transcriptional ArsR family regulator